MGRHSKRVGDASAPRERSGPMKPCEPSAAQIAAILSCDEGKYDELLAVKVASAKQLMHDAVSGDVPEPTIFESPKSHFRQRSNFTVWHENEECYLVMFDPDPNTARQPLIVTDFPRACLKTNDLMKRLLVAVRRGGVLKKKLNEVRFHMTLRGDAMVMLAYNVPIGDEWKAAAELLQVELSTLDQNVSVIGRSRKVKITVGTDFVTEKLHVALAGASVELTYKQLEGEFSQPNGAVCEKMLAWAISATNGGEMKERDLLELYCGNGNFTAALARNFRKTLATEVSKANTANARENLAANGLEAPAVVVARLSDTEMAQAMAQARDFTRLKELNVNLADYDLATLFVDPPRAGLDDKTRTGLAPTFDSIVYVSCNPTTLARDLAHLHATHRVTDFALFDQFPYTPHLECAVVLTKRPAAEIEALAAAAAAAAPADAAPDAATAAAAPAADATEVAEGEPQVKRAKLDDKRPDAV
ncbi:uracil-5--methyltransferase-domain-containing protein [Pelagophyceae sp. CCMP2097]|nr:uracil-5--methyltransferase-domain-containing protein [Pelagophyceae sp. CCMP2097]